MKQIKSYFEYAIEKKASDLHLVAEELPLVRINGNLEEIEEKKLPATELKEEILGLLTKDQKDKFVEEMELDFSTEIAGVRFRVNIHQECRRTAPASTPATRPPVLVQCDASRTTRCPESCCRNCSACSRS